MERVVGNGLSCKYPAACKLDSILRFANGTSMCRFSAVKSRNDEESFAFFAANAFCRE
jgi:hypothetical protein